MAPRNVRNNNPGNIRHGGSNWNGSVAGTDQSFVTFGSPEMGVRAMTKLLYKYNRPSSEKGYDRRSVRDIINKWAPPNENDTTAYINAVSRQLGVSPDQDIDLSSNPALTKKLVSAIIKHEGGNESLDYFKPALKTGISYADGEGKITPDPPDDIGDGSGENRRPLSAEEKQAVTELKRSKRKLDAVLNDPDSSDADIKAAKDRYEIAKAKSPLSKNSTSENQASSDTDLSDNVASSSSNSNSNFSSESLGNMKEVLQYTEQQGMYWENELDNYENYSYSLEMFIVSKDETKKFLELKDIEFKKTINGEWPEDTIPKLIISQTAVTTEFNIDNLVIENLGTGYGNVAKMVGVDVSLQFDITQIGDTDLNDTLNSAAILMGYTSLTTAVYYIKVTYNGYSYENPTNILKLPIVKVVPFRINTLVDLSTTTNQTGTVTTLGGTIANYASTTHGINTTKTDFNFPINDTLIETLSSFQDNLNSAAFGDTSYDRQTQTDFVNSYEIKLSDSFSKNYASSEMNGPISNKSSGNNNVKTKSKLQLNVGQQHGQVPVGVSIIDLIYDICVQSLKIRDELVKSQPAFSNVVRISPESVEKKHNPITNITAFHTIYNISMHREILIQNVTDQSLKISETPVMLDEIFQTGRCRKLYNYYYTGLNDQILDLNISLDKQLVKSYSPPGNEYAWNNFLKGNMQLSDVLSEKQLNNFNNVNSEIDKFDKRKKELSQTQQQKRQELNKLKRLQQDNQFSGLKDALEDPDTGIATESSINANNEKNITAFMAELENATSLQEVAAAANKTGVNIEDYVNPVISDGGDAKLADYIKTFESEFNNTTSQLEGVNDSVSSLTGKMRKIELGIQEQVGARVADDFENNKTKNVNIRKSLLGGDSMGFALAEELKEDGDIFTKLTDSEFSALMDAMQLNTVTFMNHILPSLRNAQTVSSFKSSDAENVELARSKLFESMTGDLSMSNLSITIKGDPFWMEYYITEEVKRQMFGNNNTNEQTESIITNVNGTNYFMLVVNKADGVDNFDNIKIDNLDIFLYSVKSVSNIFAQGQFTQQLKCIRLPIPDNFKRKETGNRQIGIDIQGGGDIGLDAFGGPGGIVGGNSALDAFGGPGGIVGGLVGNLTDGVNDLGFGFGPGGEFAGLDNLTAGVNDLVGQVGRIATLDPRTVAKNSFRHIHGSLAKNAHNFIFSHATPSASDVNRLAALMNEAEMAAALGSPEAVAAVEKIKNDIKNKYGNTEDASDFLQQQVDNGEIVSPELVAFLNTKVYADNTTEVIPPNNISVVDVSNIMTEIQTIEGINSLSVDELIKTPTETLMTPTVDMSPNADIPSSLRIETSNLMLGGLLPIESTEVYTDPRPPVVDYNIEQLESLDLPDDVVDGYKEVADTRNGIKVRKYLDTLPPDQVKLLNEIDNPYTVSTLPADPPVTAEKIINTPMKTPREAIMQARIQDAQTQMIAEVGGSYNDLSVDEKRHYNNLSDAYDEIDEVAQLDPIRNEAKLLKINNELDKSIRVYNDRLSGGDSEWSWTQEESEEKTQNDNTVLENISNLDNAHSTPIADRVIVDDSGSVNIIKDMSVLPVKPSDGFTLPMDYLTENDEFAITDPHLAQYELAEKNWVDFRKGEFVTVNVVDPASGKTWQTELYSSFENPELAQQYGIDTTTVVAGETISQDDPRYTQWAAGNLSNIRNQIVNELPLVTTVEIHNETAEESKKLKVPISINDFVLVEGEE